MTNNRNSYMNQTMSQNMPANARNMNMRGSCNYQNPGQGQRLAQNDCGCTGSTNPAASNAYAQRSVQNDCGCAGNTSQAASNAYAQRSAQSDCGCAGNSKFARIAEMPSGDRLSLLKYIDEVSFGAYEAILYLDTHPDCQEGMQYFRELSEKRNLALKEYAKLYGPLTLQHADENCETCWQWINQPWPWEGGSC